MHYFQNRYAYRTKPFLNLHFFLQPPPLPPGFASPVTPPRSCCRPAPLPRSCHPTPVAALPRSPGHVERSEAKSKHLTIRTFTLREILRLRPAGSAQDDRKRTLAYFPYRPSSLPRSCHPTPVAARARSPCHVERSEAKSKHLTIRTFTLREILRLRPAGSAQDDRKRTLAYFPYRPSSLPRSCHPTPVAARARSPCHVERSEAKSKHLTIRTFTLREILRLRPAGSAQDDRKRPSE